MHEKDFEQHQLFCRAMEYFWGERRTNLTPCGGDRNISREE
jgi:hypothetical protein